ncbi:sigma-70 family RNA polymerase sigma factor [Rhodoplanes sp. SY1]|uniref:sigma-70 family RNA polymerase sigma factor n=1 Tax=Rhodoplanes sp. SY1 TaxID=3166646 RepID=UPI0038B642CA
MLSSAELVWLLAGVAKGDLAAFERLYTATKGRLYAVVLGIVRRPAVAGAVLQEAYLRIFAEAARFDPAWATPMTFLVAIARHAAIVAARRDGAILIDDADTEDADAPDEVGQEEAGQDESGSEDGDAAAAPAAPPSETLKQLLGAIGRLEPDRRRMILLAYFNGIDRAGLAREFDRPVDTIKTQLRRALADLREFLGND